MSAGGYASTSYVHKGNDEAGEYDEDEILANFLESEILSVSNGITTTTTTMSRDITAQHFQEAVVEKDGEDGQLQQQQHLSTEGPAYKKKRVDLLDPDELMKVTKPEAVVPSSYKRNKVSLPSPSDRLVIVHTNTTSCSSFSSTLFSSIPPELLHHILKFLSSEDLISCSLVCRLMNLAASDESLWRRLYCLRWGLSSPAGKLHTCPWKKLYIQRDQEDMIEFIRNTPSEFKEYYIQMQAAKRSQAPLPSQVDDDCIILDKTVADLVSIWKRKRGLTDNTAPGHFCSGNTCTYSQIGDVFLCDRTGRVHVCDDACREVVLDPDNGVLVCTISGHCFDRLLSPGEELDAEQHAGTTDEPEPFMGSGRFARAYLLGYNCLDEKELEATLRFC